jgi:hypothetical protein
MRARNLRSLVGRASLACSALCLLPAAMAAEPALVHATWHALPIRMVVEQLSGLAGRPVVLDRRLDPTTPITLVVAGEPCDEVLAEIATRGGGHLLSLESTIRIVPPAKAGRCLAAEQTRRREISRLPAAQREPLTRKAACQWPAGSRPRDLVDSMADEAGIVIDGLDVIPHDHFPAANLPLLSLADRLDVILAHFDLRVAWFRGQAGSRPRGRIVPLPDAAPLTAVAKTPAPPRRPSPPRPAGTQQAYTLRLEAPLEEALAAITRQLGLRLDLDAASLAARGIAPREIARADVRSASRDELLTAILTPLGLTWRIDDGTLRVWAEPSPR